MDPSSEERTLTNMVTAFCPEELPLLDGLGSAHTHCPRVRAATTSVLVHTVMSHVTGLLEEAGALSTETRPKLQNLKCLQASTLTSRVSLCLEFFRSVEMPSQVSLALLELNGVGFSVEECERQKHVMQAKLSALESQAYSLAGRSFSLTSVDDVAQVRPTLLSSLKPSPVLTCFSPQVLFLELHLPPNGDLNGAKSKKTLGYTRRGGGRVRLGKQFSTTKVMRPSCASRFDRL